MNNLEAPAPEPEQREAEAESKEKHKQLLEPALAKKESNNSKSLKDQPVISMPTPSGPDKSGKPAPFALKVRSECPPARAECPAGKLSPAQATRQLMARNAGAASSTEASPNSDRRSHSLTPTSAKYAHRATYAWRNGQASDRPPEVCRDDQSFRKKLADIGTDFERLLRDMSCAQTENKNLRQELRRLRLSLAEREKAIKGSEKDNFNSEGDQRTTPPQRAELKEQKNESKEAPERAMGRVMTWGGMFFGRAPEGNPQPPAPDRKPPGFRPHSPRASMENIYHTNGRHPGAPNSLSVIPRSSASDDEGLEVREDAGVAISLQPRSNGGPGSSGKRGGRDQAQRRGSYRSNASSSRQVVNIDFASSQPSIADDDDEDEDDEDEEDSGAIKACSNHSSIASPDPRPAPEHGGEQQYSVRRLFKGLSGLLTGVADSDATGSLSKEGTGSMGDDTTTAGGAYLVPKTSGGKRSVSLFPNYFSPNKEEGQGEGLSIGLSEFYCSSSQSASTVDFLGNSMNRACCALAPISRCRLVWDVATVLCLLFEIWIIPFHLAFLRELPERLTVMLHCVTGFFIADILLNFWTGYIRNNDLVMRQPLMARHYLRTWFFWDLLATVPFGLLQANFLAMRLIRILKLPRLLRSIRHLRIAQFVESLFARDTMASLESNGILGGAFFAEYCGAMTLGLFVLVLGAHLHGCVFWALLVEGEAALLGVDGQIFRSVADSQGANAFKVALRQYYGSFWWAYSALTVGRSGDSISPPMWTFEVFVATERWIFLAFAGLWGVQQAMLYHESETRMQVLKDNALKFMKQHKVNFKTRLEVLSTIWQTRASIEMQRHFDELVKTAPMDARRKISEELWSKHLKSLELIRMLWDWQPELVRELAMLVRAETIAARSIICHEGDASIAAYMVMRGELRIVIRLASANIPNFTAGMWVGEKALVNPGLRRSATVVAVTLTSLMAVPAEGFQELLSRFHLRNRFEDLCESQLWKGLCGRCGSLGNHFSDACPHIGINGLLPPQMRRRIMRLREGRMAHKTSPEVVEEPRELRRASSMVPKRCSSKQLPTLERTLSEFLKQNNIFRLAPLCQRLNITSLEDLEMMELDELRIHEELTEEEEEVLSDPASFEDFRERIKSAGRVVLRKGALHRTQHLMFLSHYKVEAGTEAALMRSELEQLMSEDPCSLSRHFDVPVFLDSEDLTNLKTLQERVVNSHNIIVLLTKDVFTRPWVLVEIVSAIRWCIPVLLVTVEKAGSKFEFPTDAFFDSLSEGRSLSKQDQAVLEECGIPTEEVVNVLKSVLKRIAVPYSPHKPGVIRRAELQTLLEEVSLREEQMPFPSEMVPAVSHRGSVALAP